MNPVQSVFCSDCGGQLLTSSSSGESLRAEAAPTVKGLSLPTKGPMDQAGAPGGEDEPGEVEEDIPDWLQELGAARASGVDAESASQEQDDLPDWLRSLRESLPTEEEEMLTPGRGEEDELDLPEPQPVPPADLEPEEEEVPEWLAALPPPAVDGEGEAPPAEEEEAIADWLAELHATTGAEAVEGEPPGEEGIPTWLAELHPGAGAEAEEPELAEAEGTEEIPAWLAELQPGVGSEAEGPEALEAEEELPSWLADTRPAGSPEAPRPAELLPDWLAEAHAAEELEARGPDQGATLPEEKAAPRATAEDEGDEEAAAWLAGIRQRAGVEQPRPRPPAGEGTAEGESIPDWLVEAPPAEDAGEAAEIAAAELPVWLQGLKPAGLEPQPRSRADREPGGDVPAWLVPVAGELKEEALARAEIPDWLLALKPSELREEGEPADFEQLSGEPVEDTGLLAGLRDTLPVEMTIAQPRAAAASEPPSPIKLDTPQAHLFAEIVGRGLESAPEAVPQPRPGWRARLPLWLTYLALLAAVTVPLLLASSPLERNVEPAASVVALYEAIETLDSGRPVLVAFDYDPSSSDEMNVLARAVVGHLFDRSIPVVAVSLQPAGFPVAQSILEELAAGRPGARYGNAGYLSGGTAAIQLLGQELGLGVALLQNFQIMPPAGLPIVQGITSFESFGMLLVLTAEPDGLRAWIEQAGALQGASLGAAVSASAEPTARSYYETEPRQLLGLVSGVPGAAAYDALRGDEATLPAAATARLDSLLAGHAVFALVLVVGNLAYLVRRGPRGRR